LTSDEGHAVFLHLARGTTLHEGDWLQAETGEIAQIKAKPEPCCKRPIISAIAMLP
jgi:urease accessory protein